METTNRRAFFGSLFGQGVAAATGAVAVGAAAAPVSAQEAPAKTVHYSGSERPENPLFSGTVSYGNLLFIAGVGYHQEGDIRVHTKAVLDNIQERLERVGSSMNNVLKCNVYLHDLSDYDGMNEEFRGRFGPEPPVRTTIAAYGGIPGDSLVEIDVIATL